MHRWRRGLVDQCMWLFSSLRSHRQARGDGSKRPNPAAKQRTSPFRSQLSSHVDGVFCAASFVVARRLLTRSTTNSPPSTWMTTTMSKLHSRNDRPLLRRLSCIKWGRIDLVRSCLTGGVWLFGITSIGRESDIYGLVRSYKSVDPCIWWKEADQGSREGLLRFTHLNVNFW